MFSVEHPDIPPPESGYTRIGVDISGIVLSPYPGPSEIHSSVSFPVPSNNKYKFIQHSDRRFDTKVLDTSMPTSEISGIE